MLKFTDHCVSKIAIAVVIGGISLTHAASAADPSSDQAQDQSADTAKSGGMMKHEDGMHRVDERIKRLHETLGVTAAQEPQWKKVTQVMRQNESSIHRLVEARHENESATAIDDLKSYEKITAAHDQGLKKLIPAFEKFYNSLSTDQKTKADDMFGKYEGRIGSKDSESDTANNNEPSQTTETPTNDPTNENNVMNGNNTTNGTSADQTEAK